MGETAGEDKKKRSQEALQVLRRNKMAAAFPSERSTKDVINDILDDYEKLTKYASFPFLVLFCSASNPDGAMIYFQWKLFATL